MYTVIVIIHILVSLVLISTVLLHTGKGASLGSSFGGSTSSQALFGSAGPASLFTKVTAICAGVFMITSLYITYVSAHPESASLMLDIPVVQEAPVEKAPVEEVPAVPAAPVPSSVVEPQKSEPVASNHPDGLSAAPKATEEKKAAAEKN